LINVACIAAIGDPGYSIAIFVPIRVHWWFVYAHQ
jgi:hypothetical protein